MQSAPAHRVRLYEAPTKLPSDVQLDHYAHEHLSAYTAQALRYAGFTDSVWEAAVLSAAQSLVDHLTPEAFEALSETRQALFEARSELEAKSRLKQSTSESKESKNKQPQVKVSLKEVLERARDIGERRIAKEVATDIRLTSLNINIVFETLTPIRGSCVYVDGVFDGQSLFEEGSDPGDQGQPEWRRYGGTLRVACTPQDALRFLSPMQLVIFCAIQLKLEAHWLRDIHCIRLPPLPPTTPSEQQAGLVRRSTTSADPKLPLFQSETMTALDPPALPSEKGNRWSRANLWSLLLGKGSDDADDGAPRKNRLRQSISRSIKRRRLRRMTLTDEEWHLVDDEESPAARPNMLQTLFERTSTMPPSISAVAAKLSFVQNIPPNESKASQMAAEGLDLPAGRYAKVIARMEGTLLSTSSGVRFGPPHLLQKLRLQEIDEEGDGLDLRPVPTRQRSFPTADAENLAHSFAESSRPSTTPASTISKHSNKIAADARAGLASLSANNASLVGMTRHQSLQYLMGVRRNAAERGDPPCSALRAVTTVYYSRHETSSDISEDLRLGEYISRTVTTANQICRTPGCGMALEVHQTSFIHSDTRVDVVLRKADAKTPFEIDGEVTAWSSCAECGQQHRPMLLSAATKLMSFSKMLEMLFYDLKMAPSDVALCQHVLDSPFSLLRSFRSRDYVIQFRLSPVSLYELRTPTPLATDEINDDAPSPPHLVAEQEKELLISEAQDFGQKFTDRFDALLLRATSVKRADFPSDSLETSKAYINDIHRRLERVIKQTPLEMLNDARFAFRLLTGQAQMRLATCEAALLDKRERAHLETVSLPSFMHSDCHTVPAGNAVIARTDEPASIIAFALSASLMRQELANIHEELNDLSNSHGRVTTVPQVRDLTILQSQVGLSRDDFDKIFSEQVTVESSDLSRQAKSLLALSPRSPDSLASRFQRIVSDPSAHSTEGSVQSTQGADTPLARARDDSALLEALLVSKESTTPMSRRSTANTNSSASGVKTPKLITALATPNKRPDIETVSNITPKPELTSLASMQTPKASQPPLTVSMRDHEEDDASDGPRQSLGGASTLKSDLSRTSLSSERSATSSASSGASSIPSDPLRSNAMLNTLWPTMPWRSSKLPPGLTRSESVRKLTQNADRKRHVRYSFRDGSVRIALTAWDAPRFATLRRQCKIREQDFIDSLSRCTKWSAQGGKSKSAFFMTGNKRFVLKQMLDAWTGSERESMLSFSADYFRHLLHQSDQRPSLIAKLFGVFSISIKDDKSGDEKNLDLVVMENLFYDHAVSHIFDLKGISTRVSKDEEEPNSVMWDHAWLSKYADVILVHAFSKAIISAAIANDTAWLAQCGFQDYSALLGISEADHTMVLGIIDVLGSFNLAKLIEHRAKTALKGSAESVTVLPPSAYAERFRRALASYIVAVPEKWTSSPALDAHCPVLCCPL